MFMLSFLILTLKVSLFWSNMSFSRVFISDKLIIYFSSFSVLLRQLLLTRGEELLDFVSVEIIEIRMFECLLNIDTFGWV